MHSAGGRNDHLHYAGVRGEVALTNQQFFAHKGNPIRQQSSVWGRGMFTLANDSYE